MSYDLDAFRLPPGRSAREFIESGDREALTDDESPPTEAERIAMERAAAALLALDPGAERLDDEGWIEITSGTIQIMLSPREAGITVPYWYEGEEADAVLERMFAYARVLAGELGYTVWDPQNDTIVDPAAPDRAAASERYDEGVAMTQDIARGTGRPWWKIWG